MLACARVQAQSQPTVTGSTQVGLGGVQLISTPQSAGAATGTLVRDSGGGVHSQDSRSYARPDATTIAPAREAAGQGPLGSPQTFATTADLSYSPPVIVQDAVTVSVAEAAPMSAPAPAPTPAPLWAAVDSSRLGLSARLQQQQQKRTLTHIGAGVQTVPLTAAGKGAHKPVRMWGSPDTMPPGLV